MNPIPMGCDNNNRYDSVPAEYRDDPELYFALQASLGLDGQGSGMYD
jgi:hypothetical protein